ncbi:hypothetical protein [Paraburkholderia aromaticivorans]|uniref:hypothetical protein n=1 Tax=Paraburkholderia aromaticivorans TaxID=2026199 RepID=UPI0038B9DBEF
MYNILQSTKVYRVTDGVNEAYITGSVGSYRAIIGREYNKIKFDHAHATKENARAEAVLYARAVLSGSMELKSESGKSPEEMVDTVVRRFLRNVEHAKTVEVESISATEQGLHIKFGDKAFNRLNELEPRLAVDESSNRLSGNEPIPYFHSQGSDEPERRALTFLEGKRGIDEAAELSKTEPHLASLVARAPWTEFDRDKVVTLFSNIDRQHYDRLASRQEFSIGKADRAKAIFNNLADKIEHALRPLQTTNPLHSDEAEARLNIDYFCRAIPGYLKQNRTFAKELLDHPAGGVLHQRLDRKLNEDIELAITALQHKAFFSDMPKSLKHDTGFVELAIEQVPNLHIHKRDLSDELAAEIGENDPSKYLKAKILFQKLSPAIERQHEHEPEEEVQKPRLKI